MRLPAFTGLVNVAFFVSLSVAKTRQSVKGFFFNLHSKVLRKLVKPFELLFRSDSFNDHVSRKSARLTALVTSVIR